MNLARDLQTSSEKKLADFVLRNDTVYKVADAKGLLELSGLLEAFFEETMVDVDDEELKTIRVILLGFILASVSNMIRLGTAMHWTNKCE